MYDLGWKLFIEVKHHTRQTKFVSAIRSEFDQF